MRTNHGPSFSFIVCAALILLALPILLYAEEQGTRAETTGPERGIGVFTEYSGVTVSRGEPVRMDLVLLNKGRMDETIDVKLISVPKGWKASTKGGSYEVSGLYVPAGKTKSVALNLDPEKNVGPGVYVFGFEARTADGAFTAKHNLTVTVQLKTATGNDIQVTTAYPVLRGSTDAKFEFSLEVLNKGEADRTFNVFASAPEKWEIVIKPAFEEKQVSTFRIKAGQSQTVAIQVTPSKDSAAGEYPIPVRIASGEQTTEVKLLVALTGIYKLDAATPNGLLSLEAMRGQVSTFSFFVKNTGSAVNHGIAFDSFKPENWTVEFKPAKIDALQPGDMRQIEVGVKPSAQALVGDYSVGVAVNGEKADKTLEMRVTVKSSAAWAWIGIGIILLVIAGLCALFVWLGRR
jgi:uncharacterized membrane protein